MGVFINCVTTRYLDQRPAHGVSGKSKILATQFGAHAPKHVWNRTAKTHKNYIFVV